jgi:uncharacterized membrane protein YbhN (UPF0104 family)
MAATIEVLVLAMTAGLAVLVWSPTRQLAVPLLPRRWKDAIEQSWSLYRNNPAGVAGCFAISLASNSVVLFSLAASAAALNHSVSLAPVFEAGPLIVLANCLPLTPGGMGIGEVASDQLFTMLGVSGGAEMMLLVRILSVVATLPALLAIHRAAPKTCSDRQSNLPSSNSPPETRLAIGPH